MEHFIVDGRYKDLLKYHGIDAGIVLKKAQLPEDILNHKSITMREEEYYRFMAAIETVACDSAMPIKLSTTTQIENFSPPIFASYCSKNGRICTEVLALHYINNTDMTTNDIAYLLGYAELNSFLRAFAIWTGVSVSEYKRKRG